MPILALLSPFFAHFGPSWPSARRFLSVSDVTGSQFCTLCSYCFILVHFGAILASTWPARPTKYVVFPHENVGSREFTVFRLFCPNSPRDGAKQRPKTSKNDPKGPQRVPNGAPFWAILAPLGPFLVHFWPLWAHLGADFTTLRRARRPKWAPEWPGWPIGINSGS